MISPYMSLQDVRTRIDLLSLLSLLLHYGTQEPIPPPPLLRD